MSPKKPGSTFTARLLIVLGGALVFAQGQQPAPPPSPPLSADLNSIHRVCVEMFAGEDALVAIVREFAIASLFAARRFVVTEKCDKADAVLKGAVMERVERKVRSEGEAANFGVAAGGASGNRHSAAGAFGAAVGGSGESLFSSESGSRASVTVRLVNREGDVIWAHTQDSTGGKTKGAVSDAVDRAIKQLLREVDRVERK